MQPATASRKRPERPQRAAAAHELQPRAAPQPLGRQHRDEADARPSARRASRRTPTGRSRRRRSRAGCPSGPAPCAAAASPRPPRRDEPDGNRPVLPHDPVRLGLGRGDRLVRERDGRGPPSRRRPPGGSRRCARRGQLVEGRRQDVLPGVLLHVVEAPVPVDPAVHPCPGRRSRGRERAGPPRLHPRPPRRRGRRPACPCRTAGRPEVG